jgi:hypothetical protein
MRVVVFVIAVSMLMRVGDAVEMLMGMTVFDALSVLDKVERSISICLLLFEPNRQLVKHGDGPQSAALHSGSA